MVRLIYQYQSFFFKRLPIQVFLSAVKVCPMLHLHSYEPFELLQISEQPPLFVKHSSISLHDLLSASSLYPILHWHTGPLVHIWEQDNPEQPAITVPSVDLKNKALTFIYWKMNIIHRITRLTSCWIKQSVSSITWTSKSTVLIKITYRITSRYTQLAIINN